MQVRIGEIEKSYRIVTGLILGSLLNDILAIHCRFCASKRINMMMGMTELCFVISFSNRKIQNEFIDYEIQVRCFIQSTHYKKDNILIFFS
jgi:hypothetical protein